MLMGKIKKKIDNIFKKFFLKANHQFNPYYGHSLNI